MRPVARDDDFGDADFGVLVRGPWGRLELRHLVLIAHEGPDQSTPFVDLVGLVLDLLCHMAGRRLRDHLHHGAFHVHLPAVIKAAQSAFLVASVDQGYTAMRAVLIHHTHATLGVAKHYQILAQYARAHRVAVRLTDFFAQTHGDPVLSHHAAHGGIAFHAAKQVVFFKGQHRSSPRALVSAIGCGTAAINVRYLIIWFKKKASHVSVCQSAVIRA
ncbi:hypothetical protein SDC9_82512 [bioreactor metagenome]|uniref:Uncharacterized protein n=1 Tax=bioreactor metagenome TaxID=1076179 RepID=A0A644Z6K5_9ZZZZ